MNNKHAFLRAVLGVLGTCAIGFTSPAASAAALRFFGDAIPNVNRVMIRIDPHVPADVGEGDFTFEFWMKTNAADNNSNGGCTTGSNENWITGNIMFDRAIWTHDRHGDFGISLFSTGSAGTLAFGMFKSGGGAIGLCGSRNVADGQWHHVAITRAVSSGAIRIYVDGTLDTQGNGPTGDVSYANGVPSDVPNFITLNVDNYLGIGAEKYDADPVRYPSYDGFIDEVRLSTTIRYSSTFTPSSTPFAADAQTAALYHFDEGSGNSIVDSAPGGESVGERRFGGSPQAGPVWSTDSPFTSAPSPGTLSFSPASYSAAENVASVTITVTRNGGSSGAASVSYQTGGGTATAGSDYTAASGTLQWSNNDNAPKTFSVALLNDVADESNETVSLSLSNATGATLGTPNTATLTINDDDSAPPPAGTVQFTSGAQSVAESASSVLLNVSRTGGTAGTAAVNYQSGGGTATPAADYTAANGTLQWNAGDGATKSFQIVLIGDTAVEGNETINVALTNAVGAALGSPGASTITITDDDSAPPPPAGTLQFTSTAQTVAESAASVTFSVSRTGGTAGAASIQYATAAGSATAGTDFTATSGTLSWAAGNGTAQSIAVPILNDSQNESTESLTLALSNATGAARGTADTATISITDDDAAAPPPAPPPPGGGGGGGNSSGGGSGSWSLGWLAAFFAAFAACHFRATSSVRGDTAFAGKTGRLRIA